MSWDAKCAERKEEEALATVKVSGKKVEALPEASSAFGALAETSPYLRLLAGTQVETVTPLDTTDLLKKKCFKGEKVIILMADEKLPKAFKKLCTCGFLSAPVLERDTFIGVVEMSHFVAFMVRLLDEARESDDEGEGDETTSLSVGEWVQLPDWWKGLDTMDRWQQATVNDLLEDHWHPGRYASVFAGFSLLYAMELMARTKTHRLPVIGGRGEIVSILTASMVISLVWQHLQDPRLADFATLTVGDMMANRPFAPSQCVHRTMPALQAFARMSEENLSAVAIIDDTGSLVGALSKRDIKLIGFGAERLRLLGASVSEFKNRAMSLARREETETGRHLSPTFEAVDPSSVPSDYDGPPNVKYVTRYDTLARVIELMDDGRIHQVFICNEDSDHAGKPVPIGVMDQPDVLWALLRGLGFVSSDKHPNII